MKAYVCRRYGGPEVLELADVPKPVPKPDEVLIRIHATTVSSGDSRVRARRVPRGFGPIAPLALGFGAPRQPILGGELAGTIESVGASVSRFRPGDAVFAFPGASMGCHAEYRAVSETSPIALKPANLSFEEAATLSFGGSTAMHYLRRSPVRAGERVLVIGASGAVGAAVVQLAKHAGSRVTAVTSAGNRELVSALGADDVIDYEREDFTRRSDAWDVIADTVGATTFPRVRPRLAERGRFFAFAADVPGTIAALWVPFTGSRRIIAGPAAERPEYVHELARLAAAGVIRPMIDRRYGFDQIAEAHAYVDSGRKRGSVVVMITRFANQPSMETGP